MSKKIDHSPITDLVKALNGCSYYKHTWKCTLAAAFSDEFSKSYIHEGIHVIADKAADNFLDLLICPSEEE